MANIKSQKKRIVLNEKNRQRNIAVRSRMKTVVKKVQAAVQAKDQTQIQTALKAAVSEIDRAASKGVIHRNTAARKKSSLQHLAASAQ